MRNYIMRICMVVLIAASVNAQIDPLLARIKLSKVEIDGNYPRAIKNNLEKYRKYVK